MNFRSKYERGPASLRVVCQTIVSRVRAALLAVKRRGDLVAAAIGWLQLLVRVDSARLNRFSRWVIAQRVRGRYSRLARNGSRSQKFYGRRDRLRGLAAYSLGMSGTVNRVSDWIETGSLRHGRVHRKDMLPTAAVFALLCGGIRRSVYF